MQNKKDKSQLIPLIISLIVITMISGCSGTNPSIKSDFGEVKRNLARNPKPEPINTIEMASWHMVNGSVFEQQNRYAEAIIEYQLAYRYDSASVAVLFALAKNYRNLNYTDIALEYAEKSVLIDSTFIPALNLLVDLYIAKYQTNKAINALEYLIQLEPTKHNKLSLARLYEFKDINKSIALYQELMLDSDDPMVLFRLSELYRTSGRNDEYYGILEKSYKVRPTRDAATELTKYYFERESFEKAFPFIIESLELLSPDDMADAVGFIGVRLLIDSTNSHKKYTLDYLKAINKNFFFEWRLLQLSSYLALRINDTSAGINFQERALKLADTIANAVFDVGLFYLSIDRLAKAIGIFDSYKSKFQNDYRFPLYHAIALNEQNNLTESIKHLQHSLRLSPENIDVLSQLGLVYDRMKNPDSSDYYYEKVLSQDPDNALVSNNYAYSLAVRGSNLEKAAALSLIALEQFPDNAAYLDTYGWIQFKLGNYKDALKYIQKAAESDTIGSEVFEHLGDIYNVLDMIEEAIASYEKVLNIEPNNQTVRGKLKELLNK